LSPKETLESNMASKNGSPENLYFEDFCLDLRSLELHKRCSRRYCKGPHCW